MRLANPEVRIENTNACNARCVICPREKMTRPVVTMGNIKISGLSAGLRGYEKISCSNRERYS